MRKSVLAALGAATIAVAVPAVANHHAATEALATALADDRRADDRARDQYRNPGETLAFFGVKPGMTVVDYMPAGGWYTRVLVPYLGAEGNYIGINPDPAISPNPGFRDYASKLGANFAAQVDGWSLEGAPHAVYYSNEIEEDMHGTVDRVLIFREMHNIHRNGLMHTELTRLRDLLKDDGMLGIVQHRAKQWQAGDMVDGSRGYMRQQDVIGLVEAHGFELVGTSEVNANPKDTADWQRGVWEMPPVWGTKNPATKELGESDRMTLLFRKR